MRQALNVLSGRLDLMAARSLLAIGKNDDAAGEGEELFEATASFRDGNQLEVSVRNGERGESPFVELTLYDRDGGMLDGTIVQNLDEDLGIFANGREYEGYFVA